MLERILHRNNLITYQSPLLRAAAIPHAFSTRAGGISQNNYASLNLGPLRKGEGDANARISENFRRLRTAVGLQQHMRYEVNQIHGCNVWTAPPKPLRPNDAPQADAIVTDLSQRMLTIRTADCAPILLYDGKHIAAIHAGWRGIIAGVIFKTLKHLNPGHTIAAIGPMIRTQHFEVGDEVATTFRNNNLGDAIQQHDNKWHIDLRHAVMTQLQAAGVARDCIDSTDRCTYHDEQAFYSFRRDVTHRGQYDTGRMAAVISLDSQGSQRSAVHETQ